MDEARGHNKGAAKWFVLIPKDHKGLQIWWCTDPRGSNAIMPDNYIPDQPLLISEPHKGDR